MGALWSKIFGIPNDLTVLVLSHIDGFSSEVVYQLTKKQIPPTCGFYYADVHSGNSRCLMLDLNTNVMRNSWHRYYHWGREAFIFVVDSADPTVIEGAKEDLHKVVNDPEMKDTAILIYAFRQDQLNALTPHELEEKLSLNQLKDRTWRLQPANYQNDDRLFEGLEWLVANHKQK